MKVLLVHDGVGAIRGSEKVAIDLMIGLRSRGYDWLVLTNHKEFQIAASQYGFDTVYIAFKRLLIDNIKFKDFVDIFKAGKKLLYLIRLYNPNLIHINNGGSCQWVVPIAAFARVPTLVHLHAPWSKKMRFLLGLHHPDHILGVSMAILSDLIRDPVAAAKSSVIYNAAHLKPLHNNRVPISKLNIGIRRDQFVIALIGVLIPGKRPADAIEAVRKLTEQEGDQCVLLIIGDGELRASLELMARNLPVIFLGQRNDVSELLHDVCDAVVMPSQIEAFSLVLLESAMCKLPRIASDAGGNPEAIQNLTDGIIFPVGDTNALSQSIKKLLHNPELSRQLGMHAFQRTSLIFSEESFLNQFCSLYNKLNITQSLNLFNKILNIFKSNLFIIFDRVMSRSKNV